MGMLVQDMRYGWRMLIRNKGITAIAVITLAVGIGANTAIFSIVNSVLLRPLPYPNAERLMTIAYGTLGDAQEALNSDWQPYGSALTDDQAQRRTVMRRAIVDAKDAINRGKRR